MRTLGDYAVLLISIFGSLASIISFGTYFTPLLNEQGWIGVLFLGIISIFFLTYNLYLVFRYRKKIKYSSIFEDINIGFSELHKIDRENINDPEIIGSHLIELCDYISEAFTKVNGHHIGTCIKFLQFEDKRAIVTTLVRDKKSSSKSRKSGSEDRVKHWLDKNTDFDFIYSNFDDDTKDTSHYYKVFLPLQKDYINTRLPDWPPKKIFLLDKIIRPSYWSLPYKSTIVVPIVPLMANDQNQKALRGFLCVDSPRNIAFNKSIDIEILRGISDGLYNKIDKLYNLM